MVDDTTTPGIPECFLPARHIAEYNPVFGPTEEELLEMEANGNYVPPQPKRRNLAPPL